MISQCLQFIALLKSSFTILIFLSSVHSKPITLQIYKSENYTSLSSIISNAADYKTELVNFFDDSNYVGKIDKNLNSHINIELGQPYQRFSASVDTSSPALWIPSKQCTLSLTCFIKKTYSRTVEYEPDTTTDGQQLEVNIAYGNSNNPVTGLVGYETLTIGTINTRIFYGTHFMEATSIPRGDFLYRFADGVFGLGFSTEYVKIAPPFSTMLDRGLLDYSMFSYLITGEHGLLFLGGFDENYFDITSLQYHSLANDTMRWMINVPSITLNWKSKQLCKDDCKVMVDTATAFIAAPADALRTIAASNSIEYQGDMMKVPCRGIKDMPIIRINIDGQVTILTGKDYVIQVGDECAISFVESPKDLWIFGNLFMNKWYTIFDVGARRIGFAEPIIQTSEN